MTQQHLHNGRSHFAYAGRGLGDWLGTVPRHWEFRRAKNFLREIDIRSETGDEELLSVSHLTGVTPRSEKNVTMFEAESYEGSKLCWPGDLVINTMWAWMGALGVSSHHGIVSPSYGVYRLTNPDAFNPRYLDFLLRTPPYSSEYYCRSTGIRDSRLRLYPDEFLKIPLLYPPRDEQDAIVAFLDRKLAEIDRFIDSKRRLIELIDEERHAFVSQVVMTGLNPRAATQPTGIPGYERAPATWSRVQVGHLISVHGGHTPSKNEPSYWVGTIPWVSPKDMKVRELIDSEDHISQSALSSTSISLITPPALLVVVRGMILLRTIPTAISRVPVTINQDMKALRTNDRCSPEYLQLVFEGLEPLLMINIEESGHGTRKLPTGKLCRIQFMLPKRNEQERIIEAVHDKNSQAATSINALERELAIMNELRASIITEAVTGKINVRCKT